MQMDLDRIPTRNLGRDDRIISSHGVETRFPYLDMTFIRYVAELPIWIKCDLRSGDGYGDKSLLRHAARLVGMGPISTFKKRAMQFGESACVQPRKSSSTC
jgi:asparagine synthetase B (glutamine-hydrolysing)